MSGDENQGPGCKILYSGVRKKKELFVSAVDLLLTADNDKCWANWTEGLTEWRLVFGRYSFLNTVASMFACKTQEGVCLFVLLGLFPRYNYWWDRIRISTWWPRWPWSLPLMEISINEAETWQISKRYGQANHKKVRLTFSPLPPLPLLTSRPFPPSPPSPPSLPSSPSYCTPSLTFPPLSLPPSLSFP